jgi:MoaA/NifB/PqqE/SkfB family radical SAM enzyme
MERNMQSHDGKLAYCNLPFDELFIYSTGDVTFGCCQTIKKPLGNVRERSLEEIWNCALAEEVRRETFHPTLHPLCRVGCGVIDRIANGDPPWYQPHPSRWPHRITITLPDTHCNIGGEEPTPETACIMCPRALIGFKPRPEFTDQIVLSLKPFLGHISALVISGLAEALWKDRLFEILEQLEFARHADRITIETFSNGTTLSKRIREKWFSTCPKSRIFVSLDAATPETYRKIRRLNAYDMIVENVRCYVRERREGQLVYIANNINLLNIREIEGMIDTAGALGVDGLLLNLTSEWGGEGSHPYLFSDDTALLFAKAHLKAVKRAEQLGVSLHFIRPLYSTQPELVQLKVS